MLSKNARLRFNLNGQQVDAPIEWQDISIEADFEGGEIQPTIDIDAFTFVNQEAQTIRDWISAGRIFEGIPFNIDTYNVNSSNGSFKGYVNASNGIELFDDRTLKAKIQVADGISSVRDRLSGLTMSYLESIGVFTDSDYTKVKYVVEKADNRFEVLMNQVVLFIMTVQFEQQIKDVADNVAKVNTASIPIIVPGLPPTITFNIGAIIYASIALALQIIYTVIMLAAIIKLSIQVFETFLPTPRTHRTINLRTALTKITNHLGYTFSSRIDMLDDLVYLPSNNQSDDFNFLTGLLNIPRGTRTGLPNESDYGFTALEFFELCERMFNAKIKVLGNTLEFRTESDPFWQQTATYQMPNFLRKVKRYNTDELVFSKLLRFDTDEIADEWTINNFKGTNYEIITNDRTITNNEARYIKNHQTVSFPVCLGNRKSELNPIENSLAFLGGFIDGVINLFGGNSNLAGKITARIGVLKVGTNNTTKPKVLFIRGTKMPSNHRDLFSAKVLYDKYLNEKSFVLNNFGGQKALYSLEGLPFGFEDFLKTIENSNFVDSDNNNAKFRSLNWLISGDTASGEMEQNEIYAPNLTETYIEAE
jgi:hypothetical protein